MSKIRIVVAGVAVAALATIVLVAPATAGPVAGGPPPFLNTTVKLVNGPFDDELCLSPAGGGGGPNNAIVQYYCDADPSRLFEVLDRGNGTDELYDEHTGLCLSPAGGGTASGTPIVQYYCDTDPSRGWTLIDSTDPGGGYLLQNFHSGLCVTVGATRGPNAGVTQVGCADVTANRWYVSTADAIANVLSQWCLQPTDDSANAGIIQAGCAPYRIIADGTGALVVRDVDNGMCLSPAGGGTALNLGIVQYYCDGDPSRHWTVTRRSGAYQIRNVHSGLCLTPAGGAATRGLPIVQYYCDGDASRLWILGGGPSKI